MTSYSDSGYQDSSLSYYSNHNSVVRSEPRASLSRSPRAEGQASGQVGPPSTPHTCPHTCTHTYTLARLVSLASTVSVRSAGLISL